MTQATGSGSAMHVESLRVRLVSGGRPGPKPGLNPKIGTDKIPEIRKLLRSNKTIEEISADIGVKVSTLTRFIKQRRICNLTDRRNFILLQKSLLREEVMEARS